MTIELTSDDLEHDATPLLAFLRGYIGNNAATGGTGTTATNYFPADPSVAPYLSPEGSRQNILNGVVGGEPYLLDTTARIHTLKINASGGAEYWINGASQMDGWSGHADSPPVMLRVAQGNVYVYLASGATQAQSGLAGFHNAEVPPLWTTAGDTGGSTPLPTIGAFPTPSTIAPGSSGKIIQAGTGQALATLNAAIAVAQPGDTIQLAPGTYTEAPHAWTVPLKVDFGGATLVMTGQTGGLARGKGCLVPCADSFLMNGTITGTAMDQTPGQLTSAIRPDEGCGYLTIQNMQLHGNQCGVGHGGFNCVITLQDCDISGNGLIGSSGANTHNIYVGVECRRLTLANVVSNCCNDAHAVKSRGPEMIVNGGTFAASNGSCFDLPNGTTLPFSITSATMIKGASDGDHHVMGYGEEGPSNGLAGGTINGGAIHAGCASPFIAGPGGTITATGVAISGNPITAPGGIVLKGF